MTTFNELEASGKFRKYFLKDYRVQIPIGVYEHEKGRLQTVIFNACVLVDLENTSVIDDCITNVYNYEAIAEAIKHSLSGNHVCLQETLVDRIASNLFEDERVKAVHIRSEKTEAYKNAFSVGVEIWRTKK